MNKLSLNEDELAALVAQLDALNIEHRQLDEKISQMVAEPTLDELCIRRLKKQKLGLRDKILVIERLLEPDIPA